MITQSTKTARQDILETYGSVLLRDIAYHGCISGVANHHITYQQTNEWYDLYEEEILDYLDMCNDTEVSSLKIFGGDAEDIKQLKNNLAWAYLECLAQEITLQMEDEER